MEEKFDDPGRVGSGFFREGWDGMGWPGQAANVISLEPSHNETATALCWLVVCKTSQGGDAKCKVKAAFLLPELRRPLRCYRL